MATSRTGVSVQVDDAGSAALHMPESDSWKAPAATARSTEPRSINPNPKGGGLKDEAPSESAQAQRKEALQRGGGKLKVAAVYEVPASEPRLLDVSSLGLVCHPSIASTIQAARSCVAATRDLALSAALAASCSKARMHEETRVPQNVLAERVELRENEPGGQTDDDLSDKLLRGDVLPHPTAVNACMAERTAGSVHALCRSDSPMLEPRGAAPPPPSTPDAAAAIAADTAPSLRPRVPGAAASRSGTPPARFRVPPSPPSSGCAPYAAHINGGSAVARVVPPPKSPAPAPATADAVELGGLRVEETQTRMTASASVNEHGGLASVLLQMEGADAGRDARQAVEACLARSRLAAESSTRLPRPEILQERMFHEVHGGPAPLPICDTVPNQQDPALRGEDLRGEDRRTLDHVVLANTDLSSVFVRSVATSLAPRTLTSPLPHPPDTDYKVFAFVSAIIQATSITHLLRIILEELATCIAWEREGIGTCCRT
ncbi:hypothetical protein B0H15DRAFT_950225 [Mycena belliarum]|uniref:Uncharacterized protein n=1 Tax=Mycena belliarum TaxID=1033014 RepID=A0AAD6U3R0_9AGAR|nr:hypothetical protein B0H15DRAFT_950225 [Mycena belliae]